MKSRVRRGHRRHLLIDRNRITGRWTELPSGEPNFLTVVMVAQAPGMVQAADRRDHLAMFLHRFERAREVVILIRRRDLIVQGIDSVGNVDERAAPWRGSLNCLRAGHAFQKRQRDEAAQPAQGVPPVDEPGLALNVAHGMGLLAFLKEVG